jgi:hypothetical protein
MKLCCYLSLAICCLASSLRANGPEQASSPLAWELTPYRVQLCVVVQPSARLLAGQEALLSELLTARAHAVNGGPWQVAANQKFAAARNRWQRELPQADPPAALETDKDVDKVIFVAVREEAGEFQIAAREWDATTRLWNVPVARVTPQAGLIAAEAFTAVQEAFGPLVRIDEVVDQTTGILCRARGGAIPKPDGSFLTLPVGTSLRPVLVSTDKQGQPQPASCTVIPATYLAVLSPAPTTGGSRGLLKCGSACALGGEIFPAYHPAQLRLAVGLARSSLPVRVRVVDADAPEQPLSGYEVQRGGADAQGKKNVATGVTNQQGVVERVDLGPGLSWLHVARGNAVLGSRPVIAGLQSEVVIAVKNDRRRLELAAALAELNDELLDTLSRQMILTLRQRDAVLKRDIVLTGKLSQELRANANNPRLATKLADLEKQAASTDAATQERLADELQKAKSGVERLKEALSQVQ